jgi:lambda family phage tail tape measure protein
MSFVDSGSVTNSGADLASLLDTVQTTSNGLTISANAFSSAMTRAFTQAVAGGKQLDDVLKSLALRLSNLAVSQAFKPIASGLLDGLGGLLGGSGGGGAGGGGSSGALSTFKGQMGAIKPFAAGGVIGTPTYFPLAAGGLGLAGEAGPEAIMPLTRGSDGRLGVAMANGAPANVTVQIVTPDAASFRRSEAYLTGQIARAVARGQRSM